MRPHPGGDGRQFDSCRQPQRLRPHILVSIPCIGKGTCTFKQTPQYADTSCQTCLISFICSFQQQLAFQTCVSRAWSLDGGLWPRPSLEDIRNETELKGTGHWAEVAPTPDRSGPEQTRSLGDCGPTCAEACGYDQDACIKHPHHVSCMFTSFLFLIFPLKA